MTSISDGQFRGNVLVVGKIGCGKTTLLQKLGLYNFCGKIVKTEWVSGIEIDEKHKAETQSCFDNEVEIHIGKEPDKITSLLETFKLRTRDLIDDDVNLNNLVLSKKEKMDRLTAMDDVFGVADISKNFANSLTVLKKY